MNARRSKTAEPGTTRTWLVWIVSLLLLLQGIGLAAISQSKAEHLHWHEFLDQPLLSEAVGSISVGAVLAPLSALAILAAAGFWLRWQAGWLLAMIVQGLTQFACLVLYFQVKPAFVYPIMFYCIVMVLYLNSYGVRVLFQGSAPLPRSRLSAGESTGNPE